MNWFVIVPIDVFGCIAEWFSPRDIVVMSLSGRAIEAVCEKWMEERWRHGYSFRRCIRFAYPQRAEWYSQFRWLTPEYLKCGDRLCSRVLRAFTPYLPSALCWRPRELMVDVPPRCDRCGRIHHGSVLTMLTEFVVIVSRYGQFVAGFGAHWLCRFGCDIRCEQCDVAIDGSTGFYAELGRKISICRKCRVGDYYMTDDVYCIEGRIPILSYNCQFARVLDPGHPFIHPPLGLVARYDPDNPRLGKVKG